MSERTDLAMLAVQGPRAIAKTLPLLSASHRARALEIARFSGAALDSWFVARTGYTGEDGFEIMLPAQEAPHTWRALLAQGVTPAGLGARDTLRLEAGMNLYGNDMDESRHPLESGLTWTVAFDPETRDFIGREALERARRIGGEVLVGLILEERGVLRSHQRVCADGASNPAGGGHQRHLLPDHESRHCARARAGGDRPAGAGGHSRQTACGARGEAAVRAQRQDPGPD